MKQKRRNVCGRITAVLTVLAMILSLDFFSVNSGFLFNGSAEKVKAADMVEYLEGSWNISKNTLIYSTRAVSEYTLVDSTVKDWNTGFYVVKNDVAINDRVVVNGDVKLILCDGATLNTKKGITVPTNNSLTIYAQSEGTGTLKAVLDNDSKLIAAGIGGYYRADGEMKLPNEKIDCGNITIHGGNIDAKGYCYSGNYDCSGIWCSNFRLDRCNYVFGQKDNCKVL